MLLNKPVAEAQALNQRNNFALPIWMLLVVDQVLEVHEQLELPEKTDKEMEEENLDETEKALLREMCNVSEDLLGCCCQCLCQCLCRGITVKLTDAFSHLRWCGGSWKMITRRGSHVAREISLVLLQGLIGCSSETV